MYADIISVDSNTLYQGDVISDFQFHILESGQPIKRNETNHFELSEKADEQSTLLAIESKKITVMILSQSCDIQRRNNVIICPVYNLNEFVTDKAVNADRLRSIRERKIYYWFYLPGFNNLPESIADLQTMIYVPRTALEKHLSKRILSLSNLGRHHLGWTLANYFGRPIE
jgi:hypothetical protein